MVLLAATLVNSGLLSAQTVVDKKLAGPAGRRVQYQNDVLPILRSSCYGCHGAGTQSGGLRLDDRGAAFKGGYSGLAIAGGDSAASRLIQRVTGLSGAARMPLAGEKLSAEQIDILRAWIDQGAVWPEEAVFAGSRPIGKQANSHWAFAPLRKPITVPLLRDAWIRNSIDAFILDRLAREGLKPSSEADKRVLIRRVSLDLTGLPPSPEEVARFLDDQSPSAYERVVDRLLASRHYGEKWARHWLDLAHYGDSDGYEKDWVRPWAWRYRDWVIDAINSDLPFDQFTVEQLAGDLLPGATIEQRVATGFLRTTLTNREGGVDNEQFRFERVVDRASTVATVWLGMTFGCAQCHDHKYDPVSQKEFYQFYAFFDNSEEMQIDAPLPGEWGPWLRSHADYSRKRAELLDRYNVAQLEDEWEKQLLEAANNAGKEPRWDFAWDCLTKLVEGSDGEKIIRKSKSQRSQREQDALTDYFIFRYYISFGKEKFEETKLKELAAKLKDLKASYPQLTQAMVVSEGTVPRETRLRVQGDYRNLGIAVEPDTPAFLPPFPEKASRTRLDLARWLVSAENPLTPRVLVNRVWQEFFGTGLVKTSEDYGTQGEPPAHPELLDWLAAEFVGGDWSLKRLHKTIVMSSTYRQTSEGGPELREKDPANRLLARQSRLRLPAELVRDAELAVSGLLSRKISGPSVFPAQPAGVVDVAYNNNVSWVESTGTDRYRRGLYIHFQRSTPYPLLANFDAPKATMPVCRRLRSNTPLQALNLLNDPVFLEAAQALAARVLTGTTASWDKRLNYAFALALGRPATPWEAKRLGRYFDCQLKVFEQEPESAARLSPLNYPGVDKITGATWAALSTVLLNLDEFITRE